MKRSFLFFAFAIFLFSCKKKEIPAVDYAAEMRAFVKEISAEARAVNPSFLIVPQNGVRLITDDHHSNGVLDMEYINAIDGQGQEDLFFGFDQLNKATSEEDMDILSSFLDVLEENGKEVLVTDYCSSEEKITKSYENNNVKSYISFASPDRKLIGIPDYPAKPYHENDEDVEELAQAQNFLYLINPDKKHASKDDFVAKMGETNYDLLIVDLFFNEEALTAEDVNLLKTKANGGTRLVLCYMSIGEAEDYRYYWKEDWNKKKERPSWVYAENKKWRGNYKVFYWEPEWKQLIYGNEESYLTKIMEAGFDGTYLDIIDAYEYYLENK